MVATIKSKFGIHVKLTKCHLINIETKILKQNWNLKLAKNCFLVPITTKGGSIHLHQIFDILIEGGGLISPTPVPRILTNTIRFLQNFEYGQEI